MTRCTRTADCPVHVAGFHTTTCTHGADCLVHPDAGGLHDYTPTAADALHAVVDALRGPLPFVVEADVRRIADRLGITLER